MHVHFACDALERRHGADAVADLVERWREGDDAHLPRHGADDGAGNGALCGDTDLVGPLACVVVHAAGVHDGQDVGHVLLRKNAFARDGLHAPIGQRCGHEREIPACHENRALAEVDVEDFGGVAIEHRGLAHECCDGAVAFAGFALGAEDGFVDG